MERYCYSSEFITNKHIRRHICRFFSSVCGTRKNYTTAIDLAASRETTASLRQDAKQVACNLITWKQFAADRVDLASLSVSSQCSQHLLTPLACWPRASGVTCNVLIS